MIRYGSVCSGIEAASVAWHHLGWRPSFFSEIEAFPRAVLARHWPGVPLHGDFTTITGLEYEDIDLLVGGTPCQDFSVAGLRAGLAGARGNLTLEFVRLVARLRPRWVVWENVPGVLSSDGGRALGAFLGALEELGYGWAYRTLDAQYFGVAQRRRRVFVVAHAGDWRRPAAVLFERESLRRDPAPRRQTGQRTAVCPTLRAGGNSTGGTRPPGTDADTAESLICISSGQANAEARTDGGAPSLTCLHEAPIIAHALRGEGFDASEDGTGRGTPLVPVAVDHYNGALTGDVAATLSTGGATTTGSGPSVMVPVPMINTQGSKGNAVAQEDGPSFTLNAMHGHDVHAVAVPVAQPYTLAIRGRGETHNLEYRQDGTANALLTPNGGRGGIGVGAIAHAFDARQSDVLQYGDRTGPLDTDGHSVAVAVSCKDHGADAASDVAPTLRAMGHAGSHANGGGQMAVAFAQNQRDEVREVGVVGALAAEPGMKQQTFLATAACKTADTLSVGANQTTGFPGDIAAHGMQVRRLTPVECERLQGFPDGYTAIPWRGRPASECPDGPRYRALGNSMAVPVMRWIGERIAIVDNMPVLGDEEDLFA